MNDRPVLRIKGDLNALKAARPLAPLNHPAFRSATRECLSDIHRGPIAVPIEKFWDRRAGVLRSTCASCRFNRKIARRKKKAGPSRARREDSDTFWNTQISEHP